MVLAMIELDPILNALRELDSKDIGARIAAKAAPLLNEALKKTLAAGESPDGKPWEARKGKKGGRAYANAASRIESKAHGDLVRVTLHGPEVYGHFGARGMPIRQMLPDAGAEVPEIVKAAIVKAASDVLAEVSK